MERTTDVIMAGSSETSEHSSCIPACEICGPACARKLTIDWISDGSCETSWGMDEMIP